jgi:hypothetical protein
MILLFENGRPTPILEDGRVSGEFLANDLMSALGPVQSVGLNCKWRIVHTY